MSGRQGYQRRTYLINKRFQLRLISRVYLSILSAIFILGILFFVLSNDRLNYTAYDQILNLKTSRELTFPLIIVASLGTAFVTFIIIVCRYTLESHRIAGPIYRFENVLEEIKEGDLTVNVVLRKKDEFQEFAREFNELINFFRDNTAGYKTDLDKILRKINRLFPLVKNDEEKVFLENEIIIPLQQIKENLNKLKT